MFSLDRNLEVLLFCALASSLLATRPCDAFPEDALRVKQADLGHASVKVWLPTFVRNSSRVYTLILQPRRAHDLGRVCLCALFLPVCLFLTLLYCPVLDPKALSIYSCWRFSLFLPR